MSTEKYQALMDQMNRQKIAIDQEKVRNTFWTNQMMAKSINNVRNTIQIKTFAISYFIIIYTPLLPATKFYIWFGTSKYQENQFEGIPPYLMALMMALNNINIERILNLILNMLLQFLIILGSCEWT